MTRPTFAEWAIELAKVVATRSRDPSTKVGAVVARRDKTICSVGYNGFPRGVADTAERYDDRETKYKYVCHAEANAILTSHERFDDGHTLYCTHYPCSGCAKLIIQSGIRHVVTAEPPNFEKEWIGSDHAVTASMFHEALVTCRTLSQLAELARIIGRP